MCSVTEDNRKILPSEEPPKTLRVTLLLTVEIPLAANVDREDLEQDVLMSVRKVAAQRLPYVTDAQIAHSHEFS